MADKKWWDDPEELFLKSSHGEELYELEERPGDALPEDWDLEAQTLEEIHWKKVARLRAEDELD